MKTEAQKAAHRERNRKYRAEHREEIAERKRKWRAANPEYDRERYLAHREEIVASHHRHYLSHREEVLERTRRNIRRRNGCIDATGELKFGACEICGRVCKLCQDHDHQTGLRRGWLCSVCNVQYELHVIKNIDKIMANRGKWLLANLDAISRYDNPAYRKAA